MCWSTLTASTRAALRQKCAVPEPKKIAHITPIATPEIFKILNRFFERGNNHAALSGL